jgi:hypothetical protein
MTGGNNLGFVKTSQDTLDLKYLVYFVDLVCLV